MDRINFVIGLLALGFGVWFVGVVVERSIEKEDCHALGGPRAILRDGHCWAPDEDGRWRMVDVPWEKGK